MAVLSESDEIELKRAIDSCQSPWILAAYTNKGKRSISASMEGTLGYLDWRLHGQLSNLLRRGLMKKGSLTIIPARKKLGKASLLVFSASGKDDENKSLLDSLKKLRAERLSIAESTLPEGLSAKLKKALTKSGIAWESLEGK